MLWSRPENKRQAGKLLIVGGNKFGFAAVGSAYAAAQKAGIGTMRVLLPNALERTVGKLLPEAEFAPSTPSGSFSRPSLDRLLELSGWADGVLLAGDFGRNSETAIMLERFLNEYQGQVTVQHDGLDYFWQTKSVALNRPATNMVVNLGKLQKIAKNNWPRTPILQSMALAEMVNWLHERTIENKIGIITKQDEFYLGSIDSEVISSPAKPEQAWQTEIGAYIAVWGIQQPSKPLESLASALYSYAH